MIAQIGAQFNIGLGYTGAKVGRNLRNLFEK